MRRYEAPAKLNLALLVYPPDDSGYHPLESLVQTVQWCDLLEISEGEGSDRLLVEGADLDPEDNLVSRAVAAARRRGEVPPLGLCLTKEIPVAAGLGGGSSDAAAMQLKATRDEGRRGWVLSGHKIWTTSAHFADWYWVGARTSEPKHKGITLFLVPMNHEGFDIHATYTIGDERTNEVFFNDVFVPDSHVVGEVGEGWIYICEALDLERFAMLPVGPVEMKLKGLIDYCRGATLDGAPLAEDPIVRHTIARLCADLEVARKLQRKVISEALKNRVPTTEAAMYKLWQSQLGQRIANAALDLIGPDAQLKPGQAEAPVGGRYERSYRYTVVDTIGGGTSEVQKNIIARRALGLPKNF